MAVRTKKLVTRRGVPAAVTTIYTAGADETVIVKELRLRNASASNADTVLVRVADVVTLAGVNLFSGSLPAAGEAVVTCWLVLGPNDVIQASSSLAGTALALWISGTELEGVAD